MGQGLQRQPRGGNVMRAIGMLPALTGNIRRPGSGFLYLNGGESRGIDFDWLAGAELAAPMRRSVEPDGSRGVLADPAVAGRSSAGTSTRVASSPEQAALRAALAREDLLTVVCDLFLTGTAAFADYVLAGGGLPECDDILPSYFHHTVSAQVKAVDPPGHALRNSRSSAGWRPAWASTEQALQEGDAALIERLLAPSGVSWEELARAGTVRLYAEPRARFPTVPTAERAHRDRVGEPPRPTGTRACPSRASTRCRRPATCGFSRRRRRGS